MKAVVALLTLACSVAALPAGAKAVSRTPEETLARMAAAVRKSDVATFLACHSVDSRRMIAGSTAVSLCEARDLLRAGKKARTLPASIGADEIQALLGRLGVDDAKVKEAVKDGGTDALVRLGATLPDGPALVKDADALLKRHRSRSKLTSVLAGRKARLERVDIDGDRAVGRLPGKKVEEVHFVKEEGEWRIDALAPERLARERALEEQAGATIKRLDDAVFAYHAENRKYPASLAALAEPDILGTVYIKSGALTPPWPGARFEYRHPPKHNSDKPDIWVVHPSGGYLFGNWAAGKVIVDRR